jgi:resuscitation-promoting factor RpfA
LASTLIKRLVGVSASLALAAGLMAGAPTPAEGAGTVWDKVAQCESSGNWKINTGNGYYGGLQFLGSTWRGYGGRQYAPMAHQATKAEQIAVARRVLADVGAGAWPTCGRRAGLNRSNGKAARNATPATNPGGGSSVSPSSPTSLGIKWTPRKRAFAHKNARVRKPAYRKFIPGETIRVRRGDDLIKIARRYDVQGGWKGLYTLNRKKFTWQVKQNHRIFIGQIVRIKR